MARIDIEVGVAHNDLPLPVLLLLLLVLCLLARCVLSIIAEHGFEVALAGESFGQIFITGDEHWLSFVLRPIHLRSQLGLGQTCLLYSWIAQVFKLGLVWLLGMLVPILALVEIVKAFLCEPASLAVGLGFDASLMLVDKGKRSAKVLFAIGVKVLFVCGDGLAHLLLLHLINVQFLTTIAERLVSFMQLQAWLRIGTWLKRLHMLFVVANKVL